MKTAIITVLFLAIVFGFSQTAEASTTACGNPADSTVSITYINCDNGNPENVVNVWGTKNSQLPKIKQGETKTLLSGISFTCPSWFPMYCVDITGTQYWKDRWGR